jgi:SagB-type dehydrogenase family enzyme
MSLEMCLRTRRSSRAFSEAALTVPELAQLLWAAQGVTAPGGLRTAPSAKALYPLRLDVVASEVEGLRQGVYRFDPDGFELKPKGAAGDRRDDLVSAARDQEVMEFAAAVIAISANFRSAEREFGDRAARLVDIEVGHVSQNVCLQATALGLGALTVGSFEEDRMKRLLELGDFERPIYLLAVGPK